MEIRLPADKLARIQQLLETWLPRRKASKRQILPLVGTLQHASKVVRTGRAFVVRMYTTAAKLHKIYYITRLNRAFRSDFMPSYWLGMAIASLDTPLFHYLPIIVPKQMLQECVAVQQYWDHIGYSGNGHHNDIKLE